MKQRKTFLARFMGVAMPYHINAEHINQAQVIAQKLAKKLKTKVISVGEHRW